MDPSTAFNGTKSFHRAVDHINTLCICGRSMCISWDTLRGSRFGMNPAQKEREMVFQIGFS